LPFTLETPRFTLEPLSLSDANGIYDLDSDKEVLKYLGVEPISSIEQAKNTISKVLEQYDKYGLGRLAIKSKENYEFMGWCGVKFETAPINNHKGYYDLGYRLLRKHWGKGIGYECALETLRHAFNFLQLEKICGAAHIENAASNKILKMVGLDFVNQFEYKGISCNWYELHRTDFKQRT